MITQPQIEQLTKRTREGMTALNVTRLSIGLQTVVHISYSDFIDAFAIETTAYRLGMEIRIDVNGVTYSADVVNAGIAVEKNSEEE